MKLLTPEEAIAEIRDGDTIGVGGFTSVGAPHTLGKALLERAKFFHQKGESFKVNIITGASTVSTIDGGLAECDAINFRAPYQGNATLRRAINEGKVRYTDFHLSHFPSMLSNKLSIDYAFIEASEVSDDGKIILTGAVGIAPTLCRLAKKIIIERRSFFKNSFNGVHDIYEVGRSPIPLTNVDQRIGLPYIKIDPTKIVGVVECTEKQECCNLTEGTLETEKIGQHIAQFLLKELRKLFPLQFGVGNIANALMHELIHDDEIPAFEVYSEVLQDNVIAGIINGKISFASGCALAVSETGSKILEESWDSVRSKVLLRPQEITNHPEIIRRLGIIAINTALEADIWGNVNSTHVCGQKIMNGIGGSGDFARNAYLSIFATPSIAKEGKISSIVPMCSHVDHTEHDVQILVTEQGVADLRWKTPIERAHEIIEHCAHPMYKDALRECILKNTGAHIPIDLSRAYSFHERYLNNKTML